MQLFYFQHPHGIPNFGDDLNPWLFPKLLPNIFQTTSRNLFVGIGTVLNQKLPTSKYHKVAVFGSGVGYDNGKLPDRSNLHIYCVRGPLSAQRLDLPPEKVATDAALLLRQIYQGGKPKQYRYSFMPHFHQAINAGEKINQICQEVDIHYIDPCAPIEQVLQQIDQTEILLAEAMHGAIVADALRVPWIPIVTVYDILSFKWCDWCQSLGLDYQPNYIMPDQHVYSHGGRRLHKLKYYQKIFTNSPQYLLDLSIWLRSKPMAQQLRQIATTVPPLLSQEMQMNLALEKLLFHIEAFKSDHQKGLYAEHEI